MKTIGKLDKIATELFQCEYRFLSRSERDLVFEHYLAEKATSVEPKSRSYNGYCDLKQIEYRSDVLAEIDDLNQYLAGNVTKMGLIEGLEELLRTIRK